jgi:hypothetical protein
MPTSRANAINKDDAEAIALQALTYLASDTQRLSRFLALTGSDLGELREMAKMPEFQASVLEYMMGDESLLLAFCQETGIDPATIEPARALLAGDRRTSPARRLPGPSVA